MYIGLIIIASLATVVGVLVEVLVLNAEGWLFELIRIAQWPCMPNIGLYLHLSFVMVTSPFE